MARTLSESKGIATASTKAAWSQSTAWTAAAALTASWTAHSAAAGTSFCFASEAERFAQSQIECGISRTGAVIDWDQ